VTEPAPRSQIQAITRPDRSLWTYYVLVALASLPAFPIVGTVLYFRYHTMRYKFGDDGISMSWGILFRREVLVNYARIQDIHLRSNLVERWLGLARILIQTASGSSSAEMTIEGIKDFEALRDFLYERMRGVKDHPTTPSSAAKEVSLANAVAHPAELTLVLRDVTRELRLIREAVERKEKQP
jgi:putative membrane protein